MNYKEMTVKQLVEVAKDLNIKGRHKMKRDELLAAIESKQVVEQEVKENETNQVQNKTESPASNRGRMRVIEVWKDGKCIKTIDGLIETFKWAVENGICNQGWVKNSLKTGKETVAGRKFKEGGYLFKYAN